MTTKRDQNEINHYVNNLKNWIKPETTVYFNRINSDYQVLISTDNRIIDITYYVAYASSLAMNKKGYITRYTEDSIRISIEHLTGIEHIKTFNL